MSTYIGAQPRPAITRQQHISTIKRVRLYSPSAISTTPLFFEWSSGRFTLTLRGRVLQHNTQVLNPPLPSKFFVFVFQSKCFVGRFPFRGCRRSLRSHNAFVVIGHPDCHFVKRILILQGIVGSKPCSPMDRKAAQTAGAGALE